ncbi:hypothetical protein GEOBRER4_n1619 [Citrifermentans bremense]|uniref:GIY-YIG domain-containing protein n=1 Tax=Citrifermentans bremense TaxID=60035 RepID=A0A6S6M551_9BACT|nr:GIY-YIG nuclease family protein [Citrifermentans bremense]BCG46804.1 hypothetical protein GEOBRER4_n1619 [Citrifermentans bremense]
MERLTKIGFRPVGRWQLTQGKLDCALECEGESRNVLYAFISGGEVLYVGKTTQPLKKRMYGYQNPGTTQSTNIKGNRLLNDLITSGDTVEIYALPDHGLLHLGDFHINLAAGLEDSLIGKLQPKWNGCGLKS